VPSKTARGVEIISCNVTLLHAEAPFGRVLSGRLEVDAFVVPAKYANRSWFEDTSMDSKGYPVEADEIEGLYCMLLGCSQDNTCKKNPPEGMVSF
jgi:hypothetical protein